MGHDVFLSHSTKDKAIADAVCAALEANGMRCWIAPRDIKAGENWAASILHGIASCRVMVLVFSSHVNSSQHIRREVERAVSRGLPIAPLRIENAMPQEDMEYFLSSSHWMDALTPPLEKHLREFSRNVKALLETAGGTPLPPALADTKDDSLSPAPRVKPPARPQSRVALLVASMLLVAVVCAAWVFRDQIFHRLNVRTVAGQPANVREKGMTSAEPATRPTRIVTEIPVTPATTPSTAWAVAGSIPPVSVPPKTPDYTNTLGMKLIRIEPGELDMGSPTGEVGRIDSETLHHVKLTKPFMMGIHHVTRGQFAAFVKDDGYTTDAENEGKAWAFDGTKFTEVAGASWRNPGFDQADDHPVVEVSWNDAIAFCQWLSKKEHKRYRLPTEAQWEYACRAGSKGVYFWGDDPDAGQGYANCADLTVKDKYPDWKTFDWRDGFVFTSPVGSFKPNKFGLYDMIGNAWEWCSDSYGPYFAGDAVDPAGRGNADAKAYRVLRGGSWSDLPRSCRCASRYNSAPSNRNDNAGFRISLDF